MKYQLNKVAKTLTPAKSAPSIGPDYDYIVFHCDNCGTDLYGAWKYISAYATANAQVSDKEWPAIKKIKDDVAKEKEAIRRRTVCPICDALLSRAPGFFMQAESYDHYLDLGLENIVYKQYKSEDPLIAQMKKLRQQNQHKVSMDQAKKLGQSYDLPVRANVSPAAIDQINATPAGLQEYIKLLLTLEAGIYSVTTRLADLYDQKKEAEQGIIQEKAQISTQYSGKTPVCPPDKEAQAAQKYAAACKAELDAINKPKLPAMPKTPAKPIYETPGLFNKKKVQAQNELLLAQYQTDMAAYEKQLERYNEQVQKLNAEYKALVDAAKQKYDTAKQALDAAKKAAAARKAAWEQEMKQRQEQELQNALAALPSRIIFDRVQQEITDTTARMQELYRCRNELYSYGVIFEKYRDPVALATFYEYLMAGRVESLTGPHGAYNLYESEIRANLIISKLDTVISSLDQIKGNQYMIYSSIQNVNMSLMQLNQTASKAADSLRDMGGSLQQLSRSSELAAHNAELAAHNSAVSAYYAQLDADAAHSRSYLNARFP